MATLVINFYKGRRRPILSLFLFLSHLFAIRAVQAVLTRSLVASVTYPAQVALAGTVNGIASGTVFAGAHVCAIEPERALRTDLQALFFSR